MPILRYTTSVSAQKTLSEITAMLVKHKAEAILVEFADGQPVALSFKIATEFGPLHFRLPANTPRVYQTLVRAAGVPRANRTREHAARVGWRLVKNWLEVQLALIDAGLVDLTQVMLPFAQDGTGTTVYERMVREKFAPLLPPPSASN
jgi:hypothetical protein